METHRVTIEWAKQLLLLAREIPADKWASMQTIYAPMGDLRYKTHRFPVIPVRNGRSWAHILSYGKLEIEVVDLNPFYDPINDEITYLGYGAKTNTLVVGISYWWKGGWVYDGN